MYVMEAGVVVQMPCTMVDHANKHSRDMVYGTPSTEVYLLLHVQFATFITWIRFFVQKLGILLEITLNKWSFKDPSLKVTYEDCRGHSVGT